MSNPPYRAPRITPVQNLALPIAFCEDEVARARERVADPRTAGGDGRTAAHELELAYEELSVADEELRAQNEELVRAQQVIAAEEDRYRQLFERAPVAYVVTDARGSIVDANEAAARLLRCRREHLAGKPLVVFTQDVSRRRLRAVMRAIASSECNVTTALNVVNRRGIVRRVEVTGAPARDYRGTLVEIRWLIVDRTKQARGEQRHRRHAAALAELVEARTSELVRTQAVKDRLVATVSHEIRTALSAIGGYAEMLEMGVRGPLTEPQATDIRRIHHAYEHLTRVVDDLLSYSKLVAGQLQLDVVDVPIAGAIAAVTELVAPQASIANIRVELDAVDCSLVVRADGDRLRQILLNLVGNAVKFTPAGGSVRLSCTSDEHDVFVEVSDNGAGIAERQRDAVFQPFVRLVTPTGAAGTGLGLPISRDLARAMGGDVVLAADGGPGSRFVLRLPRSIPLARGNLER